MIMPRAMRRGLSDAWSRERVRGRAASAFALLAFLLLAVLLFWGSWSTADSHPGILPDSEAQMWWMSWMGFALGHGQNPLYSHYIGYPSGVNAMSSNTITIPGLVVLPVTATLGVITAYSLLATVAPAVSGWCAYLVARRYVRSYLAAIAGGLLYGFSPYMAAQSLGHVGLTLAFIPPLMWLVLDSVLVGKKRPVALGAIFGLLAAIQVMTAEELLATEGIAVLVALTALAAFHPRQVRSALEPGLRAGLAAAAVFVVLAGPALAFQFLGPQQVRGVIRGSETFVTDLYNFVIPTNVQLIHPAWSDEIVAMFTGTTAEWNGYIGAGLIVLLLFVVVRMHNRPVVPVAAVGALLLAIFSLGPHLHVAGEVTSWSLAWRVDGLPLLQQILPARLMLYFYLFASVLLAVYVETMLTAGGRARQVALAALLAVAMVPLLPAWPYPYRQDERPVFFRSSMVDGVGEGGAVLVLPFSRADNSDAMLWQAESGMRFSMPEGNFVSKWGTGPGPTPLSNVAEAIQAGGYAPLVDAAMRSQLSDDMRATGIKAVIVGSMPNRSEMIILFNQLYRASPIDEGGVSLWRGVPPRS